MQYLTKEEIFAARSSVFFSKFQMGDGNGNYEPAVMVAKLRGARLDRYGPIGGKDMRVIDKAMRDLAAYLGFNNVIEYQNALQTEGSKIFLRVNNGNV